MTTTNAASETSIAIAWPGRSWSEYPPAKTLRPTSTPVRERIQPILGAMPRRSRTPPTAGKLIIATPSTTSSRAHPGAQGQTADQEQDGQDERGERDAGWTWAWAWVGCVGSPRWWSSVLRFDRLLDGRTAGGRRGSGRRPIRHQRVR